MCEPTTIAIAAIATSQVMQGYAAKQQGEFENDVARYNARQIENEATRTRNIGTEEEIKHREKVAQLTSMQRAQLAASGVDVESGSALALQEDAETLGEADALRIRSNFQDRATSLEGQADITRSQGRAAQTAGQRAFAGSLLSAGGTVAGKWYTPTSSATSSTTLATTGGTPVTSNATLTYTGG
jgi:hypothetical protein